MKNGQWPLQPSNLVVQDLVDTGDLSGYTFAGPVCVACGLGLDEGDAHAPSEADAANGGSALWS